MEIRIYDKLPAEAIEIRNEVFVEEQGFKEEFDGDDEKAVHLVGFVDGKNIVTSRIIARSDTDYLIGRIAVRKAYRKQGYGALIVSAAEKLISSLGGKRIYIHSQEQASGFYLKLGYAPTGERDYEEGCPHLMLTKNL